MFYTIEENFVDNFFKDIYKSHKKNIKNKKILEKLNELKLSDHKNTELKLFDRDILMRRK